MCTYVHPPHTHTHTHTHTHSQTRTLVHVHYHTYFAQIQSDIHVHHDTKTHLHWVDGCLSDNPGGGTGKQPLVDLERFPIFVSKQLLHLHAVVV